MKSKLSYISLIISTIAILASLIINKQIADAYLRVDGKTKAWFGIYEWANFSHQYLAAVPGFIGLFLAITANEKIKAIAWTLSFSLASILLVFARVWRWMV